MDGPDASQTVDWATLDVSQISDPDVLKKLLQQAHAALEDVIDQASNNIRGVPEQINFAQRDQDDDATATAPPALMFTEQQFAELLRREHALRTSSETQQAYTEAEQRFDTDWMEVTDALQRKVLTEAGVSKLQMEVALSHFRAAPYHYPALKQIPIYHRYQRSRQGPLNEGDALPADIKLIDLSTTCSVNFTAMASGPRPVVVLAGSWT
jgi:hypothetical protein